ncbi:MAG: NYN domain-containing protein [Nitrospiraceae bacterium]|nr:NYN domain-containing protein [Nitrospiraceae bacterium]
MAQQPPVKRVIAYIDGFNLYFGLREKKWQRYYWLNVQALVQRFLKPDSRLVFTKYFTARISGSRPGDPTHRAQELDAKRQRQCDFLDALGTLPHLRIYEGHYLSKVAKCFHCNRSWQTHEEKMTDVQIATEMLTDAFGDAFDTALLISGDSDLVPPIRAVTRLFSGKRVVVAFPPKRESGQLKKVADAFLNIGRGVLKHSQFPDQVVKPDGYVLNRPTKWR